MTDWLPPGWALTQLIGAVSFTVITYKVTNVLIGIAADALARLRK